MRRVDQLGQLTTQRLKLLFVQYFQTGKIAVLPIKADLLFGQSITLHVVCFEQIGDRLMVAREIRGHFTQNTLLLYSCLLRVIKRNHQGGVPLCSTNTRSEEHTSELQSLAYLVCRL